MSTLVGTGLPASPTTQYTNFRELNKRHFSRLSPDGQNTRSKAVSETGSRAGRRIFGRRRPQSAAHFRSARWWVRTVPDGRPPPTDYAVRPPRQESAGRIPEGSCRNALLPLLTRRRASRCPRTGPHRAPATGMRSECARMPAVLPIRMLASVQRMPRLLRLIPGRSLPSPPPVCVIISVSGQTRQTILPSPAPEHARLSQGPAGMRIGHNSTSVSSCPSIFYEGES